MEIVQAKAWPKWPEPCAAPLRWLIFPRAIARRPGSWELCPVDLVGGTGIEPVTSSVSGKCGRIDI